MVWHFHFVELKNFLENSRSDTFGLGDSAYIFPDEKDQASTLKLQRLA